MTCGEREKAAEKSKPKPDVIFMIRARIDSGTARGAPQLNKDVRVLKKAEAEIICLRKQRDELSEENERLKADVELLEAADMATCEECKRLEDQIAEMTAERDLEKAWKDTHKVALDWLKKEHASLKADCAEYHQVAMNHIHANETLRRERDELLTELLRVKEICLREVGIGIVNEVVIARVKGQPA